MAWDQLAAATHLNSDRLDGVEPALLQSIREASYAGLLSLRVRALEVGGILTRLPQPDSPANELHPIACEYHYGPQLKLSEKDRAFVRAPGREPAAFRPGDRGLGPKRRNGRLRSIAIRPGDCARLRPGMLLHSDRGAPSHGRCSGEEIPAGRIRGVVRVRSGRRYFPELRLLRPPRFFILSPSRFQRRSPLHVRRVSPAGHAGPLP